MSRKDEAKPKSKPNSKSKSNAKQKLKRKTTGDPSDDDASSASGSRDDVGAADTDDAGAIDEHPWDDWTAKKHEKHQAKVHTLFHCLIFHPMVIMCVYVPWACFFVQGST